jgi:hypothetical protein
MGFTCNAKINSGTSSVPVKEGVKFVSELIGFKWEKIIKTSDINCNAAMTT